jgi:hypothetical protein
VVVDIARDTPIVIVDVPDLDASPPQVDRLSTARQTERA